VPAFATGTGGTIIFGINRDETTVTGLTGDSNSLRDQLVNFVRAAVIPMPQVTVTPYTIDGKLILALDVEQGQSPPYGLISSPDAREKPEFYVRRGASTYPAQPSDLRESTLASQPTAQPYDMVSRFGPW
jgi:predicted HTH transcriptional regulator